MSAVERLSCASAKAKARLAAMEGRGHHDVMTQKGQLLRLSTAQIESICGRTGIWKAFARKSRVELVRERAAFRAAIGFDDFRPSLWSAGISFTLD